MSSQVPSITVLRERATQLLGRGCVRGQLKAMMAGAFAAKNAGTPLDPESTSQELVTQCQGLINQADQDVLAILVRELLEFVENGGGGGGDAPAVIAPFPGIGSEGEYYAQQIRTTGATPQTFATTSGALPTGLTLDPDSGIISGTVAYPNGNLYEGTITVTNDIGSVDYPFSILINGQAPSFTMPLIGTPGAYSAAVGVIQLGDVISGILPQSVTGSAVITYSDATGLPGGLSLVDAETGEVSGTINDASQVGDLFEWGITGTNIFGEHTTGASCEFAATIYWGDWNGALPGSFTANNITSGLTHGAGFTAGPETAVRACPTGDANGVDLNMTWAALGSARQRVFAIPDGFLTGSMAAAFSSDWYPEEVGNPNVPASLTPAWPTPYQSGLVINGITYKIYVRAGGASTADWSVFFNFPA